MEKCVKNVVHILTFFNLLFKRQIKNKIEPIEPIEPKIDLYLSSS